MGLMLYICVSLLFPRIYFDIDAGQNDYGRRSIAKNRQNWNGWNVEIEVFHLRFISHIKSIRIFSLESPLFLHFGYADLSSWFISLLLFPRFFSSSLLDSALSLLFLFWFSLVFSLPLSICLSRSTNIYRSISLSLSPSLSPVSLYLSRSLPFKYFPYCNRVIAGPSLSPHKPVSNMEAIKLFRILVYYFGHQWLIYIELHYVLCVRLCVSVCCPNAKKAMNLKLFKWLVL